MNTIPTYDFPSIVYKYRSWTNEYHRKVLENNELYLSPPNSFNDPFDCKISKNYSLLDTGQKKDEYIRGIVLMNMNEILRRGLTPEGQHQVMRDRLENLEEYQRESDISAFKLHDEKFGVLSLSEVWNNILMWSHYGDFHKGICVGFHEEELRNSGLFGKGGPVVYSENYPEIYPNFSPEISEEELLKQAYLQTHYKAKDWEYEKEYRLMTTFASFLPPNRTVVIPDNCFAEIILGLEFPVEQESELIQIAKAKNIPLFKAVKVPFKFEIDRVKLA